MSVRIQTLPAESNKPCNCCGRTHRKLYLYQGYWMGKTCLDHYDFYTKWPTAPCFTQDEYFVKVAAKVKAMISR